MAPRAWSRARRGAVDAVYSYEPLLERVEKLHEARAQHYATDWDGIVRFLILDTIDNKWKDHLYAMEVLKSGINLRSYAQVDPKNEYKKEGFEKFQLLKADEYTEKYMEDNPDIFPQASLNAVVAKIKKGGQAFKSL